MKQNAMTKNKIRLPELLAPAGSFTHLKAAIKAGADAVYMGGQQFGARAYAEKMYWMRCSMRIFMKNACISQ